MFYVDKNIINNSVLSCFLISYFIEEFKKNSHTNRKPDLALLMLVLPILWHESSRTAIKSKKKTTLFNNVILDNPLIKNAFKDRISNFSGATVQGLNLAVSAGLLIRKEVDNNIYFDRSEKILPHNIISEFPDDMKKCIPRIAFWFYQLDTAEIYNLLLGDII